ncbi:MAG: DUF87 domain-containing protein [bacterium]|nr:DUF87 domain-containing protein [bacterium]
MYEIIVGRDDEDRKKFGDEAIFLLGRHYVKMGQTTSLSTNIYMDALRSHVVFCCGKRGSGKSYTMGSMAEAIMGLPEEISQNISVILLDTMGIFWTMKYENKRDEKLLKDWELRFKKLNLQIYTPSGHFRKFQEQGIPTDFPFSIRPVELSAEDWCMTFEVSINEPIGVVIGRAVEKLKESGVGYSILDIVDEIKADEKSESHLRDAAENLFMNANGWGLFDKKGTEIADLATGGKITVLDVSCYASMPGAQGIRALVIGLVAQKLFQQRMVVRRTEEKEQLNQAMNYFSELRAQNEKKQLPLIWMMVDEAHEFLPKQGRTTATDALMMLLREGRQPGISLVLASQQPGQIHTDVMTQSDIVIAHRITAQIDIEALGTLMQSYMRQGLDKAINELPRVKGAALVFDDTNERIYPARIRPRISWHGGGSPSILREKKVLL